MGHKENTESTISWYKKGEETQSKSEKIIFNIIIKENLPNLKKKGTYQGARNLLNTSWPKEGYQWLERWLSG